ncbi:MAG TPA: TIGR03790 family protein [Candidatus Acidoferrum sp.]|nr:TIGR03790 family protein [Candidatus Acidoferrum sp.]
MGGSLYRKVLGFVLLNCALALHLFAGGSGLNTVVVINQTTSESCELGNYYCQQRQIPPQNVLYINWTGGNTLWASNDLQTTLVTPLLNMLASRQLTNQIDYIVLSMDIPFQTSDGSAVDSTTAALFYGLRLGDGTDPFRTTNSYAASEAIFNPSMTVGAPGYSFLTTMITGNSLAQAEQLVNQGVASDGTFPQQPVVLAKSSDTFRNIRYAYFDNAIFDVNLLGVSTIFRTNTDSIWWPACSGYETGLANFNVTPGVFVPGTIADSLTSYGGVIFGNSSQTSLLAFTTNGAAGSYGTVAEPENDTQKFPNPRVYFYQARGFSLAESYYQSINVPYLGLIVAEPLAAPFARLGSGQWPTNLANAVLSGTTNISVNFTAHDATHPLQQVDLFVDGVYFTTLTNLAPCPGNVLTATLNGYPITYAVPTNSTLSTVAAGLAAQINAATNATQVEALTYGDRIELECIATNPVTTPYYAADSTPASTPGLSYSVNYLPASSPPQMTADLPNKNGIYTMQVGFPSTLPYVIMASTNLINWQPILTNDVPGLLNFADDDSTNFPERFYRMSWPSPNQPPKLSAPTVVGGGVYQMDVDDISGQTWAIQASTNLVNWVSIFTNQAGGPPNYVYTNAVNSPARFYRAFLTNPAPPPFTVLDESTNLTLIQVNEALLPYTVGVSTNQEQWTALETNFAIGQIQTAAASAIGTGNSFSTFLNAAQPAFMASQAVGCQWYSINSNVPPVSAEIYFTFTKTNGQTVVVSVINQSGTNSIALASQFYNAINTNSALQGSDGVVAEDYQNLGNSATFNLYARSPGYQAAQIQVRAVGYELMLEQGASGTLTQNLSDLEPRNHLYVTAGASRLALQFPLATTNLADGYHQLTAVAYEGTDVRTETQVTVPIQIQNSSLSATLTLLDLTNSAPSEGTYHIQVTANTNTVSLITLFSTGGALGAVTNESPAVFQVAGTNLWAGAHPFYAIIQTSDGHAYRTQTQSVTLGP